MNSRTLSLIKPDAVRKNKIGEILSRFEQNDLKIIAARMLTLSAQEAAQFYAAHAQRPFYAGLIDFMSSGAVVALVLCGEDAIAQNRTLMGATNPQQAAPGTIRADFADNVEQNAVHGSDSPEAAAVEIAFFFPDLS